MGSKGVEVWTPYCNPRRRHSARNARHKDTMIMSWRNATRADRYNVIVLACLMGIMLLGGGASRADVIGQAVVRIASIAVLFSSALQLDVARMRRIRTPLMFLAALAVIMVIQLVPLPPGLWTALPGHGVYHKAFAAAGVEPAWRPASITPDITLNSLLALLPAFAVVCLMALIPRQSSARVLMILLVAIAFSTALGILQIATGSPYLYQVTNNGSAVGSFANRNHAALFVALSLPLLAAWICLPGRDDRTFAMRAWFALCATAAVFPMILVTGSRAGLLIGPIGAVASVFIVAHSGLRLSPRQRAIGAMIVLATILATIGLFVFFSRDEALQRFLADEGGGKRSNQLPVFIQMARDYFPVGSGFGSFASVYRMYEPSDSLGPFYLNQAHNDPMQLLIEGGAPALILLLCFIVWSARTGLNAWRNAQTGNVIARTASVVIVLIAVSSVFDYPLRTPLMATVASIAVVWLSTGRYPHESQSKEVLGTLTDLD